jgi:hypothetical protein
MSCTRASFHALPRFLALLGASCLGLAGASAAPRPSEAIVAAIAKGDCVHAVELVNNAVASGDAQAAFTGGRMLDEGVCVEPSPELSAKFFERAVALGEPAGGIELAALVGQGRGVAQDYERAGALCRAAGIDPQARLATYPLGYACTLGAIAGRSMRLLLPPRAFRLAHDPIVVDVSAPERGGYSIVSTPPVAREGESGTGTSIRHPIVNVEQAVDDAWRAAIAAAPAPDPARRQSGTVRMPIDVDMALEATQPRDSRISHSPGTALDQMPGIQLQLVPPGAGHLKGG